MCNEGTPDQHEEGVGNGGTAIFPIQIWKKKRGVSYLPEDRNYDLYQLACQVAHALLS